MLWCDFSGEKVPWTRAVTPFSTALAAYFAVAVVVSAAGVDPRLSFSQLYRDFHKVWLAWVLLTSLRLTLPGKVPAFLGAGATAAAIVGIGQTLFERQAPGSTAWVRAHGFVHPVAYGEIMGLCWLGGLCLLLRGGDAPPGAVRRRFLLAFLAVTAAAFLLNQTRGAILGVAAGLVALGLAHKTLRRATWAALIGFPLVIGLWELLPTGHTIAAAAARAQTAGPNPYLARLTFWRVGLLMFRDHPWLGVGVGNYRTLFERYFTGTYDGESVWGSAHNLYIHQAAERGLLGLLALGAVFWTMTSRAWRRVRRVPDGLNLWAFSACVAFLVMNLTEVAFQTEQVASLMIFIWAYAEARYGAAPRS